MFNLKFRNMKKIFFILIGFIVALSSFAQDSQHLEFKGIPLDGKLSDFVSKLSKEGFTFKEYARDYVAVLEGNFAGNYATIYILATPKSKTVWKATVNYNEKESWSSLKSDYSDMKELFTKKYGEPEKHYEFFSKPYYEGDGYELQALRKEKCHYISFYKLPLGAAIVEISQFGHIQIGYEDNINYELKKKEEESEALDDI
ncbi:hypothetical protein DW110_03190 [Phocaeicola plebeius]|nr:hypothetical protein DW110_03190 [Phocaeicola plebeius]DAQ62667.1 MAG TPA: hypothetical protein [Caudoviricetes sp.]